MSHNEKLESSVENIKAKLSDLTLPDLPSNVKEVGNELLCTLIFENKRLIDNIKDQTIVKWDPEPYRDLKNTWNPLITLVQAKPYL